MRKTTKGKDSPGPPSPAAPGGTRRSSGKAKPTGEFPDLFAMFADPEETAKAPASTRTTTDRGGTTDSRATGEARPESGSGGLNHAGAGRVSETHSRSERDALAAHQERPPPAADIFGEVAAAAKTGPKRTAS
ncbi:MAG TPA: hypothetical protein VFY87_21800, partial [Geminicoccaceae bacterium]|nr:hypothetical protein [Geminicoccaceae bacterium]